MGKRARTGLRPSDPFKAIADPTRRRVLELLQANRSYGAGEIAGMFPKVSRPAISRHLKILRQAGLVHAKESGREQIYTLDPEPLRRLQNEWFAQFTQIADTALKRLKQRVEQPGD